MTILFTLLVTFTCLATISNAQIEKRSTSVGGQIYYYNSNIDFSTNQPNQTNRNAVFNISVGRALRANGVFGVSLAYSPASTKNFYNGTGYVNTEVDGYDAGLFYRHYKNLAKDFYFFIEASISYLHSKQISTDTAGAKVFTSKQSGGQFVLTPGISYRIYKKLHLEILIPNIVMLQYATTKEIMPAVTLNQKQFVATTSLNANSPIFLGVGFRFLF